MFDNVTTMSVLIVGECVSRAIIRAFVGNITSWLAETNHPISGFGFISWEEKQYICKKSIDENLQQYIGNHREYAVGEIE